MLKKIDHIELTLENCKSVIIPANKINNLKLKKVSREYWFVGEGVGMADFTVAKDVGIHFSANEDSRDNFEDLFNSSITCVSIFYSNGKEKDILVAWMDEDLDYNPYQITTYDPDTEIISILIKKGNEKC